MIARRPEGEGAALADQALEGGSVDKLVDILTNAMAQGFRERNQRASGTPGARHRSGGKR